MRIERIFAVPRSPTTRTVSPGLSFDFTGPPLAAPVRDSYFLLCQRDSRHALYLALSIEEDSEPGTPRSQIGKRHAPRVADHLLFKTLGHFFQGSELLAFVFSLENEAGVKWKFDARLGSRTLGRSVAPSPVTRPGVPRSRSFRAGCGYWPNSPARRGSAMTAPVG